jgi:DNA-binding LytR/AlgR family response regulator
MIKAIAIDDEPPALKIIENFCRKVDFVDLAKTFTRPSEAKNYLQQFPADLLFLDIQMPSVSGIDLYKSLSQEVMVIFTTAHSEYAVEGFNLSAIDYLLKPFTFERFMKAVKKAEDYYTYLHHSLSNSPEYLFVRADYSLVKVKFSDIMYIQGLDDYLKIYIKDEPVVVTRMTLKSLQEKLPANEFIRVHRSYIVPLSKVDKIRNKVLYIGSDEIPIGISYEDVINKHFS